MSGPNSIASVWRRLALLVLLLATPLALLRWFPIAVPAAEGSIVQRPLKPRPAEPDAGPRFVAVDPVDSGLVFANELLPQNRYTYLTNGAGMAVADYDQDGLPDLYLVSQDGKNKLFRQVAPLRFADVTEAAGGVDGGQGWGSGACFVDVDGDGWLDLYVCRMEAKNLLYRNRGDGTFEECAERFGLDVAAASTMAAFCDFDGDGDLDVYLVANRALHPGWALVPEVLAFLRPPADTRRAAAELVPSLQQTADARFQRAQRGDLSMRTEDLPADLREHFFVYHGRVYMAGQPDRLLRNDNGRFVEATREAGIEDFGMGLSATWLDFDQDGHPDLYVANDLESPDRLWRNLGGGRFADVTKAMLPHTAYYGMGSDAGDVDNDGRLDLFVADMSATTHKMAKILMGDMTAQRDFLIHSEPQQYMRNCLLLNTGGPRFQEAAFLAGVASTDWTWSALFGDLDNDGRLDLYCTNGIARFDMDPDLEMQKQRLWRQGREQEAIALIQNVPSVPEKNVALRNQGGLSFQKAGQEWGLDHQGIAHGAVLCDLDRDGDLDVVTNNFGENCSLFENRGSDGRRAAFVLRGRGQNPSGIGARVEIRCGSQVQVRENWISRGYLSGQEARVCFGLGASPVIDEAIVRWPSGAVQSFVALPADHEFTVTEPRDPVGMTLASSPKPEPLLVESPDGPAFRHQEAPFDDFEAQFLLPHQLSRLGPGIAMGDADGDGDDDCFVGGAAGQPGQLFRNDQGRFVPVDGPFAAEAGAEDMGLCFFDYDLDGDLDLFVASGGVEQAEGDPLLQDRIYRNEGGLRFVRDEAALPAVRTSSSSCAAGDFDLDGDLDLVVGGRAVPGKFPQAPPTRLYENQGGRFVDVTAAKAPMLQDAGMVTSVLFAPLDGDLFPELVIAAQWRPVQVWRNDAGRAFVAGPQDSAHLACSGLWNSALALDVDHDGDLDLVAGNLGLNTKYKADAKHPLSLYCADFDGNGSLDIVEAKFEGDRLLPVRGRSCSSQAMPELAEKFPTYREFASSLLADIYPAGKLQAAMRLEATCLSTCWFENRGGLSFAPTPLPRLAQIAPWFSMCAADFDGDGLQDVAAATNFFSPEPETGRFDGGLGLLLQGDGAGLLPLVPGRSGLFVAGDQKGCAVGDWNGDGAPDFMVAQSNGAVRTFLGRSPQPMQTLRLAGPAGNPAGLGSLVTVVRKGGRKSVHLIAGGSGYLSQSSASLSLPRQGDIVKVEVLWPDGVRTQASLAADASRLVLGR